MTVTKSAGRFTDPADLPDSRFPPLTGRFGDSPLNIPEIYPPSRFLLTRSDLVTVTKSAGRFTPLSQADLLTGRDLVTDLLSRFADWQIW